MINCLYMLGYLAIGVVVLGITASFDRSISKDITLFIIVVWPAYIVTVAGFVLYEYAKEATTNLRSFFK